jgi:hypothetical protein
VGTAYVSRIYDAIKRAQAERAAQDKSSDNPEFERRRAKRVDLRVSVYVYGHGPHQEPFHEEATSLVVNSHGALISISKKVRSGQKLLLTNRATHLEQPCRVVRLARRHRKRLEIAVAFTDPAPAFWFGATDSPPPAENQD